MRELEGSLIRIAAYSSLHRVPLTEDVAREVLSDLLPATRPRVITPAGDPRRDRRRCSASPIDDLSGKSRRRPLVTARQIGMYVFRELTDYSYPKIAEEFGGRDHTTVMHACEKIRGQMAETALVFDQVNELINRIKHGSQWIMLWTAGDSGSVIGDNPVPRRIGSTTPCGSCGRRSERPATTSERPEWHVVHNPQPLLLRQLRIPNW